MVVKTIVVTRHGNRGTWNLDLQTGEYSSNIASPTNIPGDPSLVANGVQQSHQLAAGLSSISPPIRLIYSSPYYRCLETIRPTAESLGLGIYPDHGLGEWFGQACFLHPIPAALVLLASFFPKISTSYAPSCHPPASGESLPQLYARVVYALSHVIAHADSVSGDEEVAIVICTHAATLIIMGRVLTGHMPTRVDAQDFKTFTAGITRFERRKEASPVHEEEGSQLGAQMPVGGWTSGRGIMGGWDCTVNCDCAHLQQGEQRGWFFSGDESFYDTTLAPSGTNSNKGGSRL